MSPFDWVWSDTHFGHKAIIEYSSRPFQDVEHMNRELIANYKACVSESDTVLWLGDCFFMSVGEASAIMAQLPGRKVLVRGNHDKSASAMASVGFDLVADSLTLSIAGQTVRAHHYPYPYTEKHDDPKKYQKHGLPWPRRSVGEYLLHGHSHSTERRVGRTIHVGVDAWGYIPVAYHRIHDLVVEGLDEL